MLWMERFSLIVYVLVTLLMLLLMLIINSQGADYTASISDWLGCFKVSFYVAGIFWILARSIDYIFGGPLRRKIKRESNDYYPIR